MLRSTHFVIFLWLLAALSIGSVQAAKKDTTPNQFTFVDQTGVALSTLVTSNTISVSGINTATSISITGGRYSKNGAAFTTASGNVGNGDTVAVQQTSSASYNATTHATLTIGGVKDIFSVTTQSVASDTTPDAFNFPDQTGVALNAPILSETITLSGVNAPAPISITGGTYSINGAAFTNANASVSNGATLQIKLTSSSSYSSATSATLTIGGVSDTFTVTTQSQAVDTTPDAFGFVDQSNVAISTAILSNVIQISGINAPAPISVTGGSYSINSASFTSGSGTVTNGASVQVRLSSSASYNTATHATLTIGGVSDTFTVTTQASSSGFVLPPASSGNPAFVSEHFSGSSNCTMCHNNLADSSGKDVSIETDWSSTMMANSARDPFWRAKVRSELNRNPLLSNVINDKCTRCHAPMANFEAKTKNEPIEVLGSGFVSSSNPRHNEALNGVSCTLCHQIQNSNNLGTLSGFTGHYEIDNSKTIFGPFDNLFPNPMIMNTGYTPTYSAHIKDSKLCSTCHNLKTPYVDEDGQILSTTPESEFPEQMPYSEWEHSSYNSSSNAKSCQQCHLSRANGVPISNRPMWLQARDGFAVHEFVGGNKLMLDILDKNKQQLGVLSNNFAETIDKTQTMLGSAASLTPANSSLANGSLEFTLKVDSNTGHKLPSAYPSRRVILHVTVKDSQGNVVFESGKINADGSVEGIDADTDQNRFEPHYDLITQDDQVQVYEAIMGNNHNDVTYTLLRGMVYLKDNRLLPQGFNKATAPNDIKVVGNALSDNNFVGGSDQITYRIAGLNGAHYQVEAELVHQPLAYAFAQDLFKEIDGEVEDFKTMFTASNLKSNRIAVSNFAVSQ